MWSHVSTCDLMWTHVISCVHMWSHVSTCDLMCPHVISCVHMWSHRFLICVHTCYHIWGNISLITRFDIISKPDICQLFFCSSTCPTYALRLGSSLLCIAAPTYRMTSATHTVSIHLLPRTGLKSHMFRWVLSRHSISWGHIHNNYQYIQYAQQSWQVPF